MCRRYQQTYPILDKRSLAFNTPIFLSGHHELQTQQSAIINPDGRFE